MTTMKRYPVLHHCLRFCKQIVPNAFAGIVDVGARFGTDFLIDIFPDSHHYLFEPVIECHKKIHELYQGKQIKYNLFEFGLTNANKQLYLHQFSSDGSGKVTHSEVREENTSESASLHSIVPIQGQRLDDVSFNPPLSELGYLVKLDVDGIEELIIEGGRTVIQAATFVVLEASVQRQNVLGRLQLMESLGFRLFDICDNAYYYNQLSCMDLVFVNERLRSQEIKLRPWEYAEWKVVWSKWQQGYPDLAKQPLPIVF
jgi:FkbM family methyltransferase